MGGDVKLGQGWGRAKDETLGGGPEPDAHPTEGVAVRPQVRGAVLLLWEPQALASKDT